MDSTRRLRGLLEMQGYLDLTDGEIRSIAPWLKVAPAACATITLSGTVLGSPALLWALAVVAVLGAVLPVHPFDLPYQLLLAGRSGRRTLPPSGPPKRFACSVAAVWLTVTGAAFAGGHATLGFSLGIVFFATAMVPVVTDVCVPSFLWTRVLGLPVRFRRRGSQQA